MYKILAITVCIVVFLFVVTLNAGQDSAAECIGQMPTVVVTAARHNAGFEWSGLLDTVVTSAAYIGHDDVAWSGLQDTVTAIEVPLPVLRGATTPTLTYGNPLLDMIGGIHRRVE